MGTAVVALIAFAIVLTTAFTAFGDIANISASSADTLRNSWREAERTVNSRVEPTSASVTTTDVDVVIANNGRVKYAEINLAEWVVVVRYEDGGGVSRVEYLSFASTLATGSWSVQQIYLDESTSTVEVFEPGILNPGEQMVITGRLSSAPGASTINQVTITPPEGGGGSVHFDG